MVPASRPTATATPPLVWESDLPLLGRDMLRQWTLAMAATALLMALILGTIFAALGNWGTMPALAALVLCSSGGLWVLGLVIMGVVFRGRYRVRYTVSDQGILLETVDRVARAANRLAVVAGVLTGKPGLAGAGLIGRSRESEAVRWTGAFTVAVAPARLQIVLRNRWRALMIVQCTPENYGPVLERVLEATRRHKTASRVAPRSPLPFYLGHSLCILLACAALVGLSEAYHLHLLASILVLCFALATLWLINLFAWVVLGGLLFMAAGTLWDLARLHESTLFAGQRWRGFEVISGDEATLLVLAGLGAAYLVWLCWQALRGGYLALLVRDQGDMDGG